MRPVKLNLVGAVRRAFMRRGVYIPPVSAEEAQSQATEQKSEPKKEPAKQSEGGSSEEGKSPNELTGSQEPQEVHEQLIDITEKAQDVLFEADTVFPFTLFPDTITLDREKVTVVTRLFFKVAKITSVPVSSVSAAEADVGPFFGSAHMSSKFFVQNKYSINFLSRDKALTLVHLLQGFIIAHEKKIDLTDIEKDDLLILLKDLGTGVSE